MASDQIDPQVLVAYVEVFAPFVNSLPARVHLTLSRADRKAASVLREIWSDELGLSGTKARPALFDQLHQSVVDRWGHNIDIQHVGVSAAVQMIQLCGSGPWPIGVAAIKAETQFMSAYKTIFPSVRKAVGPASEFFQVHSYADTKHHAVDELLAWGISESVVTYDEAAEAYNHSTELLSGLMDSIWIAAGRVEKNPRKKPATRH